jgi:hypothetical protein
MQTGRIKQFAYRLRARSMIRWIRRIAARAGVGIPAPGGLEAPDVSSLKDIPDTTNVLAAFKITGGIGDHLIAARYIRDLMAAVGEFRFDIYSARPAVARWAFGSVTGCNQCYHEFFCWDRGEVFRHYIFSAWIQQFVLVYGEYVKWLSLNLQRPKLISVCESLDRFQALHDLRPIIDQHPRFDCLLGAKAAFTNLTRYDLAHTMSGIRYGGPRLDLRTDPLFGQELGLTGSPYVTIHNGFDTEFRIEGRLVDKSTKVYPHFPEVIELLRNRCPNLRVVQLGSTTSERLKGVDVQLINKTTLPQAASIIAGAALHIDNESGLVHVAASVGTPSCVLFGPTPSAYFGYRENINLEPRVCGGCWWATSDWMINCPRGFDRPVCLGETSPEIVAEAVAAFLAGASCGTSEIRVSADLRV